MLDRVLDRVNLTEAAILAVVAVLTIGGTGGASTQQSGDAGFGVAGVALLATAVLALLFRHRHPVATLAVVLGATLSYWSLGYARGPVFLPLIVALVSAVLNGHRRAAVAAVVVGYVGFPWGGYLLGRVDDRPTWGHLLGLAAWLVTLLSVTEMVRNRRDRLEAAALSEEEAQRRRSTEERLRIARELHDVVAHNMSLISIQAGVALHLMDQQPEHARTALTTIKQASKDALVELRSILGVLRQVDAPEDGAPDGSDGAAPRRPAPGLERLDDLVARSQAAGVDVRVELDDAIGDPARLPRPVDLAAYRIVQESLTNVAKHSDDATPLVRIHLDEDESGGGLTVEVLDEGSFRPRPAAAPPAGGHGIVGMRERVTLLGGRLEVGPRPGRGFAVRAWLPLGPPGEAADAADSAGTPTEPGEAAASADASTAAADAPAPSEAPGTSTETADTSTAPTEAAGRSRAGEPR